MTISTKKVAGRLLCTLLLIGVLASSGMAQEEGDKLIGEDDGIQVYRSEDGKIKIKKEGAEEGTWIAVLDPEEDGNVMLLRRKIEGDELGEGSHARVIVRERVEGEGEGHANVIIRKEIDGDALDEEKNVFVFKSDDGDEHTVVMKSDDDGSFSWTTPGRKRIMLKGDVDPEGMLEDFYMHFDDDLPGMTGGRFDIYAPHFDHSEPLIWIGEGGELRREAMKMDRKSRELARKIAAAEEADKAALEAELDALLLDIFAKKQEARQEEMERLQEKLEELRSDHSKREADRDGIIERRKKRLLGENDPLEW